LKRNVEAVQVYNLCANQVIVAGMGEIIALKYESMKWAMELCNVPNSRRLDCLNRVNTIFSEIQELRADK
jgi:hypothetical protein